LCYYFNSNRGKKNRNKRQRTGNPTNTADETAANQAASTHNAFNQHQDIIADAAQDENNQDGDIDASDDNATN